jgi:H+/Cl- antiporter ClcA
MVPLEKRWYQKLLLLAPVIGVAGGVLAVAFMGITGTANDLLYGNTGTGWWAGRWWWIPLTALGGLVVALLRKTWKISKNVPGAIALAHQAWVDPSKAIYWVIISTVSLVMGASLGPSFGLVVMGGGFGSWLVTRLGKQYDEEEAKQGFALTGMTGGMGGGYSAPLFATVLASELSPTSKSNYVAAFIPELFAATLGFVIYYGVTGSSMLGSYRLPEYQLHVIDLIFGVLLGVLAVFVLLLHTYISKLVSAAASLIPNPYLLGAVGGALVGLIAFALPLTATAGSKQLGVELEIAETMGVGLIAAILIGKMIAISISQSSGFLGGIVFPAIFLGGTAGLLVHSIFPGIPIALCVGGMLAAVPGAFLNAPLALIIIAAGTVRLQPEALVPIGIAVVIAHMLMSFIRKYVIKETLPPGN